MSTIYCTGRNYINHAKELNNPIPEKPLVFLVSASSLREFNQAPIAFEDETFHYEGEIVLKMARDHKLNERINSTSIEEIALGVDLTRRQEQTSLKTQGYPWTTSKSFLGSTIISDFVSIDKFSDLGKIEYKFYLNGELRQKGNTKDMIFSIDEICDYLNTFSPLKEGDLVLTGTPEGVGEMKKGDRFSMEFSGKEISFGGEL